MDRIQIGLRLREMRGNRSREEIALAVGVTAQAISNYECGLRIPSDDKKIKLANYFKTSVQELFYSRNE